MKIERFLLWYSQQSILREERSESVALFEVVVDDVRGLVRLEQEIDKRDVTEELHVSKDLMSYFEWNPSWQLELSMAMHNMRPELEADEELPEPLKLAERSLDKVRYK